MGFGGRDEARGKPEDRGYPKSFDERNRHVHIEVFRRKPCENRRKRNRPNQGGGG
jgi:hypothetical protein